MMQRVLRSMNRILESNKDKVLVDDTMEVDIIESDVDLDESDVVEPDLDPPQSMGDPSVELTPENREAAQESKSMAMDAILEGKLDTAIEHLTEAIKQNPKSTLLLASRANIFLKLKKPNAAIRDADAALRMNDDLVKGYKARGMAKVQLGLWEEATYDLRLASLLDFDEETARMLKKVDLNVKKIVEHRKKWENLKKEREQKKVEHKKLKKLKGKDGEEYKDKKPFDSKKPNVPMDGGSSNDDNVESDVNDPPQKMGDPSVKGTEERQEAAQLLKAKAMEAIADGKFNEAIDYLTEAIMLNPKSALLYANRASSFIKLKKPNAAIRDADAALQINPDSAKGFKARGMAKAMSGLWEEAARDLHVAAKLDFDEEIGQMLKKVEPNAKKIEELTKTKLKRKRHQDAEAASVFKDGEIITIHSGSELKDKLNAASKTSRLSILYFTATWCGPCRQIGPVFTSLAAKYPKAVFLKVDVDEATDAAAEWQISSMPCFFFVKKGVEVDKFIGVDENVLEQKIAQLAE